MSIHDIYTEEEIKTIQKLLKKQFQAKWYNILVYFLRVLMKQKRLVFTSTEFYMWLRKFTNVKQRTVRKGLFHLARRGWIKRLMNNLYRVERSMLIDLGYYDIFSESE